MILVDPRSGSKEVADYISAVPGHPPVELQEMEYGDIAFTGNGPGGEATFVGVELKNVSDAVNCISTQRFTGYQLPGMKQTFDHSYLFIQGEYRAEWETGALQIRLDKGKGEFWWTVTTGGRAWTHYEFTAWLTMIELGWGIRTRSTSGLKDTARTVIEMYRVLQKPWEKHRTVNPFYLGELPSPTPFVKPSVVERVVAQIDGVGPAKAREIGKRFKSVIALLSPNTTLPDPPLQRLLPEWKGIPGVGKQTATRIIRELWGAA